MSLSILPVPRDPLNPFLPSFLYQLSSQNPEHLLLFAAGNDGDLGDPGRATCTINTPAIGKNVLAVGASSSGRTRFPLTEDEGDTTETSSLDSSNIDTMSIFSSYGPTSDGRIKPEVVAPGDQVYCCCTCLVLFFTTDIIVCCAGPCERHIVLSSTLPLCSV